MILKQILLKRRILFLIFNAYTSVPDIRSPSDPPDVI